MINKKFLGFLLIVMILAGSITPANAGWRRPPAPRGPFHRGFHPRGYHVDILPFAAATLFIAGATYYYWEGEYYRREANKKYIVVNPPVGTVVTAIPANYQTVIIDGNPYYIVNGVTYIYTSSGYQVVPTPKTIVVNNAVEPVPLPQQISQIPATINPNEAFTVNIPNQRGSYTSVILKRSGNGFIGPQGEYYSEFPKIDQLKVMYGK